MKRGHVRPSKDITSHLKNPYPRGPGPSDLGDKSNPRSARPNYKANMATRKAQPKHHPYSKG